MTGAEASGAARDRAVIVLDDEGVVRSWDEGAACVFGYSAEQAVGAPLTSLIVPAGLQAAHDEGFSRYVQAGHRLTRPASWTVPATTADGATVFVDLQLAPVELDGAHLTVAIVKEAPIGRSSTTPLPAMLEALFARAPEIITVVDRDGQQYSVNDAGARILGYDTALQVPPSGYAFIHSDDRILFTEQRRRQRERASAVEQGIRYRVLDANGEWRWLESLFVDLYDVPGIESLVVFSRDVTEAERHRAELAEARMEAVRQAEQLRQFDQARNDFVLSVSHELRTPLTSLISGADLLLDDATAPLDPDIRETVEILQRNGHRLRRLVENLLLVSRLGQGMEDFVPGPVDVRRLLAKAVEVARPAADARSVELELAVVPGPIVTGDLQQLRAVADNVVGNAVKYTAPGTTVCIEASPHDDGWTIDVRDQGPGIEPGEEERIFQRFARGAAARSASASGTGLGLAIARAIMELHGGTLEAVDHAGAGALFRINLPYAPATHEEPAR